jgi:hypothetical protein
LLPTFAAKKVILLLKKIKKVAAQKNNFAAHFTNSQLKLTQFYQTF